MEALDEFLSRAIPVARRLGIDTIQFKCGGRQMSFDVRNNALKLGAFRAPVESVSIHGLQSFAEHLLRRFPACIRWVGTVELLQHWRDATGEQVSAWKFWRMARDLPGLRWHRLQKARGGWVDPVKIAQFLREREGGNLSVVVAAENATAARQGPVTL